MTWTYEYSGTSHLLHKVINPESETEEQTFYTTYDGLPRANLQLDGEGDTIAGIQYSAAGDNEIRAINEGGRVYTDTYDSRNLLISQTDANGDTQTYDFDGDFNRDFVEDGKGNETRYVRDSLGRTLSTTDADNNVTTFAYYGDTTNLQSTTSPQLEYRINFTATGTYYVWLRGYAPNAAGDSLYVALDDQPPVVLTGLPPRQWGWANDSSLGNRVTFTVASPGEYKLFLWQREDGLRLDRLVLTLDGNDEPIGAGPTESLRLMLE